MDDLLTTNRAARLGTCLFCNRPLLTSWLKIPVTRGRTVYTARVHVGCYDLAHSGLTGPALAAAKAKRDKTLTEVETLFLGTPAHGAEVGV